jgi:hypothetical protein
LIFIVLILCALAFFPYVTEGCEPFNIRRIIATVLILLYGLLYFYVPPFLAVNNPNAGKLYELFPVFCYVVVLYTDEYGAKGQKVLMWLASLFWLLIFMLLTYFKVYVW